GVKKLSLRLTVLVAANAGMATRPAAVARARMRTRPSSFFMGFSGRSGRCSSRKHPRKPNGALRALLDHQLHPEPVHRADDVVRALRVWDGRERPARLGLRVELLGAA